MDGRAGVSGSVASADDDGEWGADPYLRRRPVDGKPAAEHVWYIFYPDGKLPGITRRVSTGTTDESVAKDRFELWKHARRQQHPRETVNDVLDFYVAALRDRRAKRVKSVVSALKRVRVTFGALKPTAITSADVRAYSVARSKEVAQTGKGKGQRPVSPRMIAVELAYLRAALNMAEGEKLITEAPKITLPKNAGVRRRKRFLTPAERKRLAVALNHEDTPAHVRLAVQLALLTAQRSIAIRELKWDHVNFEAGIIYFSDTDPDPSSNKIRQDMPITEVLAIILTAAKEIARTEWVIEWRDSRVLSLKKAFGSLMKRANIQDATIHDLRRTVATAAVQRGAPLEWVATLLGNDIAVTRKHYAVVTAQFMSGVLGFVSDDDEGDD